MGVQESSLGYALIQWVIAAASLLGTSKLLPGFKVKGFGSALWAAVVIGIANVIVRPVLLFLTFPINLLTLGLFTLVVNAAVLKLCAAMLSGFDIDGWFPAILGSILITLINVFLNYLLF